VLEGPHLRVLDHVLGFPLVPHDGPCDPVEPLVVAAHEQLEESGLAHSYLFDDLCSRAQGLKLAFGEVDIEEH